jgi:hypothetical protein
LCLDIVVLSYIPSSTGVTLMYQAYNVGTMNKKTMEILLAIGSVVVFVVLLIMVHATGMEPQGYGFLGALVLFVLTVSLAGIKLTNIE